ncbi:MAG: nucleotidyltransferase domain-containing protein [Candidatus Wallbacteria bacterium]|nr:nucleotidyltransferase domain-containing protein [Candidatus Wallbacteria bacterium]
MVEKSVLSSVEKYLNTLDAGGMKVSFGVIFGSMANGHSHQYSDIDLIVISPSFDGEYSRDQINTLWRTAAAVDSRIEPIPCGERQWIEDDTLPVLEIGRREGQIVRLSDRNS